eukprot:jgi/Chrzof1/3208/Cz12g16010.t1
MQGSSSRVKTIALDSSMSSAALPQYHLRIGPSRQQRITDDETIPSDQLQEHQQVHQQKLQEHQQLHHQHHRHHDEIATLQEKLDSHMQIADMYRDALEGSRRENQAAQTQTNQLQQKLSEYQLYTEQVAQYTQQVHEQMRQAVLDKDRAISNLSQQQQKQLQQQQDLRSMRQQNEALMQAKVNTEAANTLLQEKVVHQDRQLSEQQHYMQQLSQDLLAAAGRDQATASITKLQQKLNLQEEQCAQQQQELQCLLQQVQSAVDCKQMADNTNAMLMLKVEQLQLILQQSSLQQVDLDVHETVVAAKDQAVAANRMLQDNLKQQEARYAVLNEQCRQLSEMLRAARKSLRSAAHDQDHTNTLHRLLQQDYDDMRHVNSSLQQRIDCADSAAKQVRHYVEWAQIMEAFRELDGVRVTIDTTGVDTVGDFGAQADIGGGIRPATWTTPKGQVGAVAKCVGHLGTDLEEAMIHLHLHHKCPGAVIKPLGLHAADAVKQGGGYTKALYLMLERADLGSLRSVLRRNARAMSTAQRVTVLRKAAEALLQLLRAGFVHLDLKPENILVQTQSGQTKLLLADFGHTRQHGSLADGCGKVRAAAIGIAVRMCPSKPSYMPQNHPRAS